MVMQMQKQRMWLEPLFVFNLSLSQCLTLTIVQTLRVNKASYIEGSVCQVLSVLMPPDMIAY